MKSLSKWDQEEFKLILHTVDGDSVDKISRDMNLPKWFIIYRINEIEYKLTEYEKLYPDGVFVETETTL